MDYAQQIYQLKLFDNALIVTKGGNLQVMRVPGGWLINGAFVPYTSEGSSILKPEMPEHSTDILTSLAIELEDLRVAARKARTYSQSYDILRNGLGRIIQSIRGVVNEIQRTDT